MFAVINSGGRTYDVICPTDYMIEKMMKLNMLYDYDFNEKKELTIEGTMSNGKPGYGAFFKMVHCQHDYLGFMYYKNGDDGKSLILRFDYLNNNQDGYYIENHIYYQMNFYYLFY